jgi:hypothetical protein
MGSSIQKEVAASPSSTRVQSAGVSGYCTRSMGQGTCASPVTHDAGERLVEKRVQCSLDLVRVV